MRYTGLDFHLWFGRTGVGMSHKPLTCGKAGPRVWGEIRIDPASEKSRSTENDGAAGVIDRGKYLFSWIEDPPPSSLDLSIMSTEEVGSPVRLGAGSFTTVYVISGGLIAFKEVAHTDNTEKLRQE